MRSILAALRKVESDSCIEAVREAGSRLHLWLSLAFFALLVLHVWAGLEFGLRWLR